MHITADIGGTSARLQLASDDSLMNRVEAEYKKTYDTCGIASIVSLFKQFIAESGYQGHISLIVCGIPGDVINNCVGM